nr:hypothetical protein [Tanacetum cinerariifolium]
MSMTCFSDQVNTVIRDCNDILSELPNKNPYELSSALTNLKDKVLETIVLPLPAPPPQIVPPEPRVQEIPKVTQVSEPAPPSPSLPPQTTLDAPISEDQPQATQLPKPLSLALSMTAVAID